VRSGAAGHVAAPEPTYVGRCGSKLQLAWQRMDAYHAPCLDLELVCGGTRSSGCRQRPSDPPQERLRTHRWGQFFDAPLGYLIFLLGSRRWTPGGARAGGLEVGDIDGGAPRGCWLQGPAAPTTVVEDVNGGSPGGAGGKVRQRPPLKLKMSMAGPLWVLAARSGSGHHRS
jgi:hypothetical protein